MTRTESPHCVRLRISAVACLWLGVSILSPPIVRAQETIEISETLVTTIQQVRVPALRGGAVVELDVAEGDFVKAGQKLARVDYREPQLARLRAQAEYEAAVKAAESELAVRLSMKQHELAKSDLARATRARSMLVGSIPDEEYENRKLQVERTSLEIEKAKEQRENAIAQAALRENDLRSAELDLTLTRVVSPIDGVVVSIERNEGEWVKTGDTILELLGTTRLRAEALIDVSQLTQPIIGKRVTLSVEMPDGSVEKFRGVMRFESPEINPLDNRVSAWAEIANPTRRLRPGMRGRMTIQLADPESSANRRVSVQPATNNSSASKRVTSK